MIIKIFIKIIITYLSFVFVQVFAADNIATPSTYKVTMKKVELCTSAGCRNPTLLAEKDGTFNIASATAGADVGDWISSFALEIGLTYTHIKATLSTTMTMAGFTTNSDISSDNCVTESSPNTASAANQGGIVDGSDSTDNADMTYIVPNGANADNGDPYGDIDFAASGITRANNAATMTWIGALTNSYTPSINSSPKITIKFDVTNQLKSTQQAADTCYMWLEPPSVSVSLTD
ncbi:MAG: hypothetical protein CFH15_01357 [Alphaproteobacteria bacterium MarineAlpha5_Bin5]|nr:MAG: hypothetical protein CFH15_01357 [Alphaproteobacteria bacterium MarineAlpha5_Bin5]PPR51911.1 MAG: hypothetical protein CFH14_00593 [Alphaproteobacteria bacterium MarineAlpha5_Bin4]|tara:strand:+ start:3195 stop:3896 length:702 start_codon:yes stop_codon:yes gene_type:complete